MSNASAAGPITVLLPWEENFRELDLPPLEVVKVYHGVPWTDLSPKDFNPLLATVRSVLRAGVPADLTVDLTTMTSDRAQRDRAIQRRGLQITTFPTAHFILTQPMALPATATDGKAFTVQATGDLTLHGQTKSETIPIQARLKGTQIDLVGSTTFPMADFGITPPDIGGFVSVEPNATLEFEVLLDRA